MNIQATQDNPETSPAVTLVIVSVVQFLSPFMSSAVVVTLLSIGK